MNSTIHIGAVLRNAARSITMTITDIKIDFTRLHDNVFITYTFETEQYGNGTETVGMTNFHKNLSDEQLF